jgi:hypothetical protein
MALRPGKNQARYLHPLAPQGIPSPLALVRGLKHPNSGRDGITPAQTLRSLLLMRIKNWDYRELREHINDGHTLRAFTDFNSQRVPKHDAFNRAFNRITPGSWRTCSTSGVWSSRKARMPCRSGSRWTPWFCNSRSAKLN